MKLLPTKGSSHLFRTIQSSSHPATTATTEEETSDMNNSDTVDKLAVFLAKRDGIDKLVKTFQYVSKLVQWQVDTSMPGVTDRAKKWEAASGISRKAFRTGRFLNGFNTIRRTAPTQTPFFQALTVFANGGEMVYFFFDHLSWLSRVGVLSPRLASRTSYVSAFGEAVGYAFFIIADVIAIKRSLELRRRLVSGDLDDDDEDEGEEKARSIGGDVVMRWMSVAANLADFVIAMAEVQPNPVCNHQLTLGICGLVSAWAGWYRNWPS